MHTLHRYWYNKSLRPSQFKGCDLVVGFDLDGFSLDQPHVCALKGVIADEAAYETGMTRRLLKLQARWEEQNVHRATAVIATSRHSAMRIRDLYGLREMPRIVPEPIDLGVWRTLLDSAPLADRPPGFVVLAVARFYRRKRIDILLDAARAIEDEIPGFAVRIVGDGPEAARLRRMAPRSTTFVGAVSRRQLAAEYRNCDVFCLPTAQEGFGIVFLEAMAAGCPIVAARSSAVPEVVPHALLVEPDDAAALAAALLQVWRDADLRASVAQAGAARVVEYDASVVAGQFLEALGV